MQQPTDPLMSLPRRVLALDSDRAYSKLVVHESGDATAKEMLDGVTLESLLSGPVVRRDEAMGLLAGLYLWHDHLPESHTISQSIPSPTGSFWHAIMHRREGDFSNSKYWYARCENHPASAFIAARVNQEIAALPADKEILRLTHGTWNPSAFVDLVARIHQQPSDPRRQLAIAIQRIEWRGLFDWSTRQAAGL